MLRPLWGMCLLAGWLIGLASLVGLAGLAGTAGLQPAVAADESASVVPGLVILQTANGLPGRGSQDQVSAQRIHVTRDRLRLDDADSGVSYLFRLDQDPPQIYEVAPDRSEFRKGDDLDNIQRERDRFEQQLLVSIKSEADGEVRRAELERNYLRADGSRVVTVTRMAGAGELLGHPVDRYVVKENDFIVVDVKTTLALDLQIPFFDFYRRVGAFSDEVLAKLQGIPGVPLAASITVRTAGLTYPITAIVLDVQQVQLALSEFELPTGAIEHVESPFVPCATCSREVERAAPGARILISGRNHLFCSTKCRDQFRKERYQRERQPGSKDPEREVPGAKQ